MTTIKVFITPKGEYRRLTCEGHTGYAPAGEDVVCGAVSVLVINTVNSLDKLTDAKLRIESDEDKALIDMEFLESPGKEGALLMDSLLLGVKSIQSEYGKQFLDVQIKEV